MPSLRTIPDLPKGVSSPARKIELRRAFSLLRYTSDLKDEYARALGYSVLQALTYHLLSYSLQFFINVLLPQRAVGWCLLYGLAWVLSFGVHAWFTLDCSFCKYNIVRTLMARLRAALIKKLQVLQIRYFADEGTGATAAKLLSDIERVQGLYSWFLDGFVTSVLNVLLVFPFLWLLDPTLTLVVVLYVPLIVVLQRSLAGRLSERAHAFRKGNQNLSTKVVEFISGIKHIRLQASEDIHGQSLIKSVEELRVADLRLNRVMRALSMAIQFMGESVPMALWVMAGIVMAQRGTFDFGAMVAFIALTQRLVGTMNGLFQSFDQVVTATPSITAISDLLESSEIENSGPRRKDFKLRGGIEVEGLSFSYPARGGALQLSNVNLAIHPGEKLALVGESGAGKTTFVEVLLGLHQRKSGTIRFDGLDTDILDLHTLRSQISIVSQETFLFNCSIYENLRFVNLSASMEQVREACLKSEILDFIESLPDGFHTDVGEHGVRLSGGQRQRIGLARAFLRASTIIILDEPSSNLDVITEHRFVDTLYRHLQGKTLIVIAHRLSTIAGVDRVVAFERGQVMEQGAPSELYARAGLFRRMVDSSIAPTALPGFHTPSAKAG